MPSMHAAVVTSFAEPPHYREFDVPEPQNDHEVLVDVLAIGVHPRVRSGAAGNHYTSTGALPMVPGIDAVGRFSDGRLVYFVADDHAIGTMAQKAVVDTRRAIVLDPGADIPRIAASMNPAMSSWVALRRRSPLQPGASVLVIGATGAAGMAAVQIAKRLGAGRVIGVGRDADRLEAVRTLGADEVVRLTDDVEATDDAIATAAADVDVALDYVWGEPAARSIVAILTARKDRARALDWVQIGSMAGSTIELPSAAFRSANFRLLGSGQGSVSPAAYLAELPSLADELQRGRIGVTPKTVPLAEVERAWARQDPVGERTVLVPR